MLALSTAVILYSLLVCHTYRTAKRYIQSTPPAQDISAPENKMKEIKHILGTKYEALHNFKACLAFVNCCIILVELKLVSMILV